MKRIMAQVQMIAKFDVSGNATPARFAYDDKVIDVERVIGVREEKFAGKRTLVFGCQSEVDGELRRYELKYEVPTGIWFLVKI